MSTMSQVSQATLRMSVMPLYPTSTQQIIQPEASLLTTAEHPDLQRQSLKSKHSQYARHKTIMTTDQSIQRIVEQIR
jgi:hypothetical protein